jgi:multidrug efflux pump subunit AcrA (membrane-fusion protein)
MKPEHSSACIKPNEGKMNSRPRRRAATASRMAFATFVFVALSGCEQNGFVPPPPPKVDVAVPVQRAVTRYLEATGNTAPINTVDLVARVKGVLQSINYKDGEFVKAGTTLFTIEPDTYKFKLEQAQAAEAGAQAR